MVLPDPTSAEQAAGSITAEVELKVEPRPLHAANTGPLVSPPLVLSLHSLPPSFNKVLFQLIVTNLAILSCKQLLTGL